MPHYFFHLRNDLDVPDPEGRDLPDLDTAREKARREARILIGELAKEQGRIVLHHRIDIEDEKGVMLDTVLFSDVVVIEQ
jgi:hypothetical protein